jgi:CIC family chloride channel protein
MKKLRSLFHSFSPRIRALTAKGLPDSLVLGVAAGVVGLLGGAGVWAFKALFNLLQTVFFVDFMALMKPSGAWMVIFIPVLGGLLVGLIAHYWIGPERVAGVPGIIETSALAGSRLPYRKLPVRILAAILSIGSGASVGPEDPSVQIGANLGSLVGQFLRLSDERMRALVAGGAAAGIAAAFNAPIAGVFFALEVILGEISSVSFGFAAIAAFVSAVFTQAVSGTQPAFAIPQYTFGSLWELPLYLALGVLAGPIAAIYIRLIYFSKARFAKLILPDWSKPALAGLLVGISGYFLPQVFGVGYTTIGAILESAALPAGLLFVLLLVKLILTPISVGGGFVGGVFAPALFLGATLGGGFGLLAQQAFPGLGITAPSFALVGMAAVLAGTVHAPLTAILLLFEMTHDYRIVLPLLFAVAVSLLISRQIQKDSVYQHALTLKGIRIERGRDVDVLEGLRVSDVANRDFATLRLKDTLLEAIDRLTASHYHGLPVLDDQDRLAGMLTFQDIESAHSDEPEQTPMTVGELCTRHLETVFPDDPLSTALHKMGIRDIGQLPVVSREQPDVLVGLLRRGDVIRAYEVALARRASARHRIHAARLGILTGVNTPELQTQEVTVQADSPCAGHAIQDTCWPKSCVISSIRRGRNFLLPHGDTTLQPGDVLVVVTKGDGLADVRELCTRASTE